MHWRVNWILLAKYRDIHMAPQYQQSDAFRPWLWNSYTNSFFQNLKSATALYYRQYYTGPSEQCAVVVWPRGGHPTQTDRRRGVISLLKTLPGNPPEKCTVNTAGTLRLSCMFCNCMKYGAALDVFTVENTESYVTSWFSVKVTAVTLVNTVVLDLGMGLGLSDSNDLFFYSVPQILKYKYTL